MTYLDQWAERLPIYRLEATIRYQAGLAATGRLDQLALRRLNRLRTIWASRTGRR